MRSLWRPASCLAIALLAACANDSQFPTASGKASVRAINAIPASPEIGFFIEERLIGGVTYKSASSQARYDDLEYRFNFEVAFPGEATTRRVARRTLDVIANMDYSFVITGPLASPRITLWEGAERTWDGSETVFELRIGHTAESLGSVDIHVAPPGTPPAVGQELGTLSFREILPAVDLQEGEYVVTITAAGNPADILYTSQTTTFAAQTALIISAFDGDENDLAPVAVRAFGTAGTTRLPDANALPTLRFIQASMALAAADVYDDPALAAPLVSNHLFGNVTSDFARAAGSVPLIYTAAGNPGAILFEDELNVAAGVHNHYVVVGGSSDELAGVAFVPDRRSVETLSKLRVMHAAANHGQLDVYVVEPDAGIEEEVPTLFGLPFGTPPVNTTVAEGSYDVYVTTSGEQTILAGPLRVDAALGGVLDLIILDAVDPAITDVRVIPPP